MNNDILISIIIPIYNAEQYLKDCLDSIINQSLKNYEVIMIDDGSKDNSKLIAKEYVELYNRVRYIYQENKGVSEARNRGIAEARGKYITFVDADDWIEPDMYEIMCNQLESNNSEMVMCNFIKEYEDKSKNEVEELPFEGIKGFDDNDSIISNLIKNMIGTKSLNSKSIMASVWRMVFKRDFIEVNNIRFDKNIIIGEDMIFCIGYLKKCKSIIVLDKVLYHYRILQSSAMSRYRENHWEVATIFNDNLEKSLGDVDIHDKSEIIAFDLIRSSINSVSMVCKSENEVSKSEKINQIKNICLDSKLRRAIKNIKVSELNTKDKLRIWLLKYNMKRVLFILYRLKEKCKKN